YCEEYHRKLEHHLEAHGEELSEERREELEEKRDHYGWEARRLTPLIKYLAGERAVQMSRMAIQIHGGAGYTKEYEPEKLLRDATVMPIYEGTSQIQALMATKDRLAKILEAPQEFLSDLARARWESLTSSDPLKQKLAQVRLSSLRAQRYLISKTAVDKVAEVTQKPIEEWPSELRDGWDPDSDFAHALLHAERLIKLLVDEAVCELLYEQATEYPDRRDVFERYVERAIPRCEYYVNEITSTGERLLEELHVGGDDSTPAAAE
ncbi:MAG: acyl-CoA dehydrogenase family protein, partial [Bradymonadaceae bacterium]